MLTSSFFRNAHGVFIAFDLTDRQSFEEAPKHHKSVERYCHTSNVAISLIGTKSDLSSARVVSVAEAEQMAHSLGCTGYLETSAATGSNVDICFTSLAQKLVQVNPLVDGAQEIESKVIIDESPHPKPSKCC